MKRRIVSLVLAAALLLAMLPCYVQDASAATQSAYAPYAMIEYGYSSSVTTGTIRYISQVVGDSYFYSSYWPSSTFGNYIGAQVECGTASISMALSYIGINKTPDDILTPYNGSTMFALGWGGSTYMSVSASALSTAVDRYINGNGKYSPPVIHIPGYSTAGHYVVVAGRISSTQYQILDPWQRTVTTMTVSGSSATYSKYGSTTYDTIDQIHQWYNESAAMDYTSSCESYPAHCLVTVTEATNINTQPCSAGSNESTTIEPATIGGTYTATKMYKNSFGNLWYEVILENGQTGHLYGGATRYVEQLTSDITLTGASFPNGHVVGNSFNISGTIKSTSNQINTVTVNVYSGFGTSGTKVIGNSDTVSGYSYTLPYSTIDATTKFGSVPTGNHTYTISVDYVNYYADSATTMQSNTGTINLAEEYFVVIPSSADQSTCSHSNSTTVIKAATCTSTGVSVTSCSKCGLVTENTTAALSHTYGSWTTVNATCTAAGSKTRSCINCGNVETQTIAAAGHKYSLKIQPATCSSYAVYEYTCANCGDYYKLSTDEMATQWLEAVPSGMSSSQFNSKTQYRYSDYQTLTSYQTADEIGDGYTLINTELVWQEDESVYYVDEWPSGFDTTSDIYDTYDNNPILAREGDWFKVVENSNQLVGYLYYHWCSASDSNHYSYASKSSTHNIFHAYYSTTNPGTYTCDTSDMSYKTSNSCCSSGNSEWFFVTEVYLQNTSTYLKRFTYECWTDWSAWSDTVYTASDSRQVETRTVYQLKEAKLGSHSYASATCTQPQTCTSCGATNGTVTGHNYQAVVKAPGCTSGGYTTYTCSSCGDSYTGNVLPATGHTWSNGTCATCGAVCGHNYSNGTCTICGYQETVVENSKDIKWQVTKGTTASSASTNLRFLTWVDSPANYSSVTFNVTINGKTSKLKSTTAYSAILASGTAIRNPANIFKDDTANYFVTYTLKNVPSSYFDIPIVVTVTWTDLAGNQTTSESKTIVISSDWS